MNKPHELSPPHKCKPLAVISNMDKGRDWWLGELTEPVPEWPQELFCLHLKTPLKDVVFLMNLADFQAIATLAQVANGNPINRTWLERMAEHYKRAAVKRIEHANRN